MVGDGTSTGDDGTGGGGGGGGGGGSGDGTGGGGISGNISESTTWAGDLTISGITTIDPGVTVTVAAGTHLTMKSTAALQIKGILDAQGTSAENVTIEPETTGFNGIVISSGGELKYSYVVQTGGNITTQGGKATIVDSKMSHAAGDFLVMSGGAIDVSYSAIGVEAPATDTTHCDMHFGGTGNVIKFTHSNVSSSSYGIMFYGGMGADFTYTNWFGNTIDVDTDQATPVSGDFSMGWFEKGAPTGQGITANNISATRLTACDGTNDATCAGPRP